MRLQKILAVSVMLLAGFGLFAQNRTVQGIVFDSAQQPLPGVGVVLQGTTNGTVTGTDGTYSLKVPSGQAVLASFQV